MTTTNPVIDDPQAFRQWLESLPADEIVGKAVCATACPLATWLKAQGAREPVINGFSWREIGTIEAIYLPAWAYEFVQAADVREHAAPITAAECLALLATICPEGGAG
jgi:hypothetical protein